MVFTELIPNSEFLECIPESSLSTNAKTDGLVPTDPFIDMFCKLLINQISDQTVLGRGSFGRVLLALICTKSFAVKICSGSSCKCQGEINGLLAKHANISKVYRVMEVNGTDLEPNLINYILSVGLSLDNFRRFGAQVVVMEFAGRQTLQQLLDDTRQQMSVERLNTLLRQIVSALSHIHDLKLVHLDLKPANVMVMTTNSEDICKLIDFGSSKRLEVEHICSEAFRRSNRSPMGTVIYCAPEIFKNNLVTTKADIYSFGITLWQMISRNIPFNGFNSHSLIYKVVSDRLRPQLEDIDVNEYGVEYIDLMVKCWDHERTRRPSARQICQLLSKLLVNSIK